MMLEIDVDGIRTAHRAGAAARAQGADHRPAFPMSMIQAENVVQLACAIVKKPYTDERSWQRWRAASPDAASAPALGRRQLIAIAPWTTWRRPRR